MEDQLFVADTPQLADVVRGGFVRPQLVVQAAPVVVKSSGLPWWVWLAAGGALWWMAKD